jgi:hypothetical protein
MAVVYDEGYEKPTRTFSFTDKSDDLHGIDFESVHRIRLQKNYASESQENKLPKIHSVITIFWDREYSDLVKTEFTVGNELALEIMNKWFAYMNEDD